jgi:four helix bundle protein
LGDFKKLKVWETAHQLTMAIYKCTASFPDNERFGLTTQMRRAAASIPANIAEGCGRRSDNELGRVVRISLGSATELEYHLFLAKDLGLLSISLYDLLINTTNAVQGMLASLNSTVKQQPSKRRVATAHSS